jgi:hypothetical protein
VVLAILLCAAGVLSFSLKELSMERGKVWPFSQISTSFLIFSCKVKKKSKWGFLGKRR